MPRDKKTIWKRRSPASIASRSGPRPVPSTFRELETDMHILADSRLCANNQSQDNSSPALPRGKAQPTQRQHAIFNNGTAEQILAHDLDRMLKVSASGYVDPAILGRFAEIFPPSNNMGGTPPLPPLFLPQCEISPVSIVKNKTNIDWLGWTSALEVEAVRCGLLCIFPSMVFTRNSHGMPGYPESQSLTVDGVQFGLFGFGAKHGRCFVSLTGTACKTWTDSDLENVYEMLVILEARLSRVDICFDIYNGELTWDHARWSYDQGAFRVKNAGVDPVLKVVGESCGGENLGRTMYTGRRDGHVMGRIYEKGLEVFAKLPDNYRDLSLTRELISGVKPEFADSWLRLEVEYKKKGDYVLPLRMILDRDLFFAGAYPYFADALGAADGVRPPSLKTETEIDLMAMIGHGRRAYGPLVHSMREMKFTADEIVDFLDAGKHSEKLVKSGILAAVVKAVAEFEAKNPDFDIPF